MEGQNIWVAVRSLRDLMSLACEVEESLGTGPELSSMMFPSVYGKALVWEELPLVPACEGNTTTPFTSFHLG